MSQKNDKASLIPRDEDRLVRPNFITEIIDADLRAGRVQEVVTRFPPEPNGYLHVGHVKAIVVDFGIGADYRGRTYLRFDDTNPTTENVEYVEAIKRDVRWLGFEWDDLRHASDYFEQLYGFAVQLIESGKAYVDSLSESEIREYRGTVTEPGRNSPYRDRPVEENLDLFERMRKGEFAEGEHVLRAKIDMAASNMLMRDPLLYRIRHAHHYRTGDEWHIYPLYDFAHPLSDQIEGVTHSLCTLEFENNRELYDWVLDNTTGEPRSHQYEFARLNIDYTVLSKRRLIELVQGGHVDGWDDPRMPTIAALRRRGVRPEALREFVNRVGVTKTNSRTDYSLLEHSIRDDLNTLAPRVMAVTRPLKVVITNLAEDHREDLDASYWPHDVPREGSRPLPFGRELWIERSDFSEDPPKGWRRLSPGEAVRLRHGYVIRCDEVVRGADGEIAELRCSYDPATLGANPQGQRVRGTIHWLAAATALPAEFRLYDRLFATADPSAAKAVFTDNLNPESLRVEHGFVEPSVSADPEDTRYQFERLGYFWRDPKESDPSRLVFNRIVTLKDTFTGRSEEAGRDGRAQEQAQEQAQEKARASAAKAQGTGNGKSRGRDEEYDPAAELGPEELQVFERLRAEYGLDAHQAAVLAADTELPGFFEEAAAGAGGARSEGAAAAANWIVNELVRERRERDGEVRLTPGGLARLVTLVAEGVISSRAAKQVFAELVAEGGDPDAIVEAKGLRQVSDESALLPVVERLIAENPDKVRSYREGKTGLAGFFIGQAMRETGGQGNPQLVRELVERELAKA